MSIKFLSRLRKINCLNKHQIYGLGRRNVSVKILDSPEACLEAVRNKDPHQSEFLQAVFEVTHSCRPLFRKFPDYNFVLPVICEPERIIQFRVPWVDDHGHTHVNRAYRVQFNQALGPYKGGLRFHPSVNQSIIKFLGFEQIFKNALTGVPMGGAKGGSDFNPRDKSTAEVCRFCQSFMSEIFSYIGPDTDVPAGDIGVGSREIGFLYGEWKRITAKHVGVFTGKGIGWGGSHIRTEATGYGTVYIIDLAIKERGESMEGKRCVISGSGNVSIYTAEKIFDLGGVVLSFSDSDGALIEPKGFSKKQFEQIRNLKKDRKRLSEYADCHYSKTCKYFPKSKVWKHLENVDCAFPSATQNELDENDAKYLVDHGCKYVGEGANMPCSPAAIDIFQTYCKAYIPGKAANAGGVGVSGLEMTQNSIRQTWPREEVDKKLQIMMHRIYKDISDAANELEEPENYLLGANAAGFRKVADAMFDLGQPLKSWNPEFVIEPFDPKEKLN